MGPKTVAGAAFALFFLIAFNAWRQGGTYALRSWVSKIFLNRPLTKPTTTRAGIGKLTPAAQRVVKRSPIDPWAQAAVR